MSPELQGEVLGMNLYTRSGGFLPRLCRTIWKLERLMAGADVLREKAEKLQVGVQ